MMLTQQTITDNEIRALSWKQPMAELMKHGKTETRTWSTDYRGLVLICASVNPFGDRELVDLCGPENYARILQMLGPKWFNAVKRGSAIAVGRLVNCLPWKGEGPLVLSTFVKDLNGRFLWTFDDVTPIETFPWRGQLGWKALTLEEKARIKIL
jgi:hypothetical protein